MSVTDDAPEELVLIGYEKLADHGFALPCFGRAIGANAVYVARPSRPGDPRTKIAGFEIHDPENLEPLPQGRSAKNDDPWLDVFLWAGEVYVGTKAEIWNATATVRSGIAGQAPMTLMNLAEGVPNISIGDLANVTYDWLQQRYGSSAALTWQVDIYLRGLAIRGLRRRLGKAVQAGRVRLGLQNVRLSLTGKTLTVRLPATLTEALRVTATDLYSFVKAASDFGFQATIVRDGASSTGLATKTTIAGTTLLMRLRRGRGETQTQIPFRVLDAFFGDDIRVLAARGGTVREMTLSMSDERRNTMKLQLPEMANMRDPFARFKRTARGVTYEIHDLESPDGQAIKKELDEGLRNGTTYQTQGAATWWRILK